MKCGTVKVGYGRGRPRSSGMVVWTREVGTSPGDTFSYNAGTPAHAILGSDQTQGVEGGEQIGGKLCGNGRISPLLDKRQGVRLHR